MIARGNPIAVATLFSTILMLYYRQHDRAYDNVGKRPGKSPQTLEKAQNRRGPSADEALWGGALLGRVERVDVLRARPNLLKGPLEGVDRGRVGD